MENAPIPLYYKLYTQLKESIDKGQYTRGDKLPTEKELCEKHSVSRLTVRRALEELRREGIIERQKGRGTFVREIKREERLTNLTGFTDEANREGKKAHSKVLENRLVKIPSGTVSEFEMPAEGMVVLLKRVRYLNDEPYAIEEAYLNPNADIRLLNIMDRNMEKESLYKILLNEFNLNISYAEEEMELTRLDQDAAVHLNQNEGDYAILRRRYTFTKDGKCVEYVSSLYRGDKYKFKIVRNI